LVIKSALHPSIARVQKRKCRQSGILKHKPGDRSKPVVPHKFGESGEGDETGLRQVLSMRLNRFPHWRFPLRISYFDWRIRKA
jgi:hypothetical protein